MVSWRKDSMTAVTVRNEIKILFISFSSGRVDSIVIDNDVTNYTLSSLHPATEYEINLNAVRGSQESKSITTSVFTGQYGPHKEQTSISVTMPLFPCTFLLVQMYIVLYNFCIHIPLHILFHILHQMFWYPLLSQPQCHYRKWLCKGTEQFVKCFCSKSQCTHCVHIVFMESLSPHPAQFYRTTNAILFCSII